MGKKLLPINCRFKPTVLLILLKNKYQLNNLTVSESLDQHSLTVGNCNNNNLIIKVFPKKAAVKWWCHRVHGVSLKKGHYLGVYKYRKIYSDVNKTVAFITNIRGEIIQCSNVEKQHYMFGLTEENMLTSQLVGSGIVIR